MRYWKHFMIGLLLTISPSVQADTVSPMDVLVQLLGEGQVLESEMAVEEPVRVHVGRPVQSSRVTTPTARNRLGSEIECLMRNMYHEAYGEGDLGMVAVAYVTLNRVSNQKYPGSICNVVYQPYQFSWTNNQRKRHARIPQTAQARVRRLAEAVMNQSYRNPIGRALYFNHVSLSPRHTRGRRSQVIGNHRFYH